MHIYNIYVGGWVPEEYLVHLLEGAADLARGQPLAHVPRYAVASGSDALRHDEPHLFFYFSNF